MHHEVVGSSNDQCMRFDAGCRPHRPPFITQSTMSLAINPAPSSGSSGSAAPWEVVADVHPGRGIRHPTATCEPLVVIDNRHLAEFSLGQHRPSRLAGSKWSPSSNLSIDLDQPMARCLRLMMRATRDKLGGTPDQQHAPCCCHQQAEHRSGYRY